MFHLFHFFGNFILCMFHYFEFYPSFQDLRKKNQEILDYSKKESRKFWNIWNNAIRFSSLFS